MNEPAGDQITELLHNDLDLTDADDLDTTDEPDSEEEPAVRATREGLPGSFRMRHDAHYVDELLSRSAGAASMFDRERTSQPAPPSVARARPEAPGASARVEPAPIFTSAAAVALLAGRLETVVSHADGASLNPGSSPIFARTIQVEVARVSRLARAAAVLANPESPIRRSISAAQIADRVRRAAAPAARMGGLEYDVTLEDPAATILAEAGLVVQAIAGTVDALVDLLLADPRASLDDQEGAAARLSISVQSVKIRPALIVDVTCPAIFVGAPADQFFDNTADAYRRAPAAGILLAAAAHIARAHGGRADVKPHSGVGVTITYVFPQVLSDYPLS